MASFLRTAKRKQNKKGSKYFERQAQKALEQVLKPKTVLDLPSIDKMVPQQAKAETAVKKPTTPKVEVEQSIYDKAKNKQPLSRVEFEELRKDYNQFVSFVKSFSIDINADLQGQAKELGYTTEQKMPYDIMTEEERIVLASMMADGAKIAREHREGTVALEASTAAKVREAEARTAQYREDSKIRRDLMTLIEEHLKQNITAKFDDFMNMLDSSNAMYDEYALDLMNELKQKFAEADINQKQAFIEQFKSEVFTMYDDGKYMNDPDSQDIRDNVQGMINFFD